MIQVDQITKRYGTFEAIRNVSFTIGRGEVVGLLGPNGAGKTTTMRILCGCIGATSGHASIDGHDIIQEPLLVKQRIGYLPETPPLYPTMTVTDYLRFAAKIKNVAEPTTAVKDVIGKVGLQTVSHRIIEHLSKGYRQRVGIAQALVHDPDVLVLDEPTSGLDPAQRKEIRQLLASLAAGDRTVILSTHVLSEVESVCERVIIIDQGQLVQDDQIDRLRSSSNAIRLRVSDPCPQLTDALAATSGITGVTPSDDGVYILAAEHDVRATVAQAAVAFGLIELGLAEQLEDVYLRLTTPESK